MGLKYSIVITLYLYFFIEMKFTLWFVKLCYKNKKIEIISAQDVFPPPPPLALKIMPTQK